MAPRAWKCFLLLLLVGFLSPPILGQKKPAKRSGYVITSKDPKQLKKKFSRLEKRKADLRKAISQKRREAYRVRRDLQQIDQQLQITSSRLQQTQVRLQAARQEQKTLQKRLHILTERLKRRRQLLAQRLRAAYKHGSVSYLNVLCGARSMRDLLSRGYVLRRIVMTDRALMQGIQQDREALAEAKARQDQLVAEITALERGLEAQAREHRLAQREKQEALQQINTERALYEQQLEEIEEESRRIAQAIRALQQTPVGRARAAKAWSGRFRCPVAGHLTSRFGMRHHPIFGVTKMHTGIDLAAPTGAPIHAADGGTVIEAGYRRGYGNLVIIDHGGGIATLYAHCSALLVTLGQEVKRGDLIARVGSTGYSTGPHLHFEVRVNGEPVDPSHFGF